MPVAGKIVSGAAHRQVSGVSWTIVSVPARSRYAKRESARAAKSVPLAPLGPPLARVTVPLKPLGTLSAPRTSFTPDVVGPYELRLTARVAGQPVTDQVTVDAIPRSPIVTVDTSESSNGTAGIAVGTTNYPAPPMAVDETGKPEWSGVGAGNEYFLALWQVLVLDRATLAPLANWTYGECYPGNNPEEASVCRMGADNHLVVVNINADLSGLSAPNGAIVITTSHPAGSDSSGNDYWGPPTDLNIATNHLTAMGFPSDDKLLTGAGAGSVSAIGVLGMPVGDATIKVDPGGSGQITGYLGQDPLNLYTFMPSAREDFDTRVTDTCGSSGVDCTVVQSVGDATDTGVIPNGEGAYVVAAYNPYSLKQVRGGVFETSDDPGGVQASDMVHWLSSLYGTGDLVLITAVRTPKMGAHPMVDPRSSKEAWLELAAQVAVVGGTRDLFNRSASSTYSLYSLIGWTGAGEGNGIETSSGTGRLRGALVPNVRSRFRPTNVSADGPAHELLEQLVMRTPDPVWPGDHTPGRRAAIDWIGCNVPQLGSQPRTAYWETPFDATLEQSIDNGIDALTFNATNPNCPRTVAFTQDQFAWAQGELKQEVEWVANVDDFFQILKNPEASITGGNEMSAWATAQTLNDNLTKQLEALKSTATQFGWFDIASAVLNMVGGFSSFAKAGEQFAKFAAVFAGSTALAGTLFQDLDTGAPSNADRTVEVDNLVNTLTEEASSQALAYVAMEKMIVSDYSKLSVLGHYFNCDANDGGCGPHGEYDDFSLSTNRRVAAGEAATRAIDRVLYEKIVPLAFPVWNTGGTQDPNDFSLWSCVNPNDDPFPGAPGIDRTATLQQIDPASPGIANAKTDNIYQSYIMVARSRTTYSWPSKTVLERMYDPVVVSPKVSDGGLGLRPQDVLPYSTSVYHPGPLVICSWS